LILSRNIKGFWKRTGSGLMRNICCDCVLVNQVFSNSTTLWLGKPGVHIHSQPHIGMWG
jgi:hypothetical protein